MNNHEQSKYLNKNVLLLLENKTIEFGDKVALSMKSYLGWQELSFKGLGILAKRLANYLMKIGINKGDKVAILSESMPEWGATLFGSILSGAIVVPLDIKLTIYEWTSILSDCMPKVLLVSSTYFEKALELNPIYISNCCLGKWQSSHNFQFSYEKKQMKETAQTPGSAKRVG